MKNRQKIVDSHIHWWDLEKNYYPWLTDKKPTEGGLAVAESLMQTYLPEHYFEDAKNYEIIGVVHVQGEWDPDNPVGETKWLQNLADISGFPQGIVGAVNFADTSKKVERILEGHCEYSNIRSIRHMLNYISHNPSLCWANENFLENSTWLKNYSLLKKYNLGFDLMCFDIQMEKMADLIKKNPDIPVYLEHAGMPYQHDQEGFQRWRKNLEILAANENIVIKISGFRNTMDTWDVNLITKYILTSIDIFGIERICFASNFPTDKQYTDMDTIWSTFLEITKSLTPEEKDKVFMNNAIKFYNLKI